MNLTNDDTTSNTRPVSIGTSGPSPRVKLGRPPAVQMSEVKLRTICGQIAKGAPQWVAAASVGVPARTFKNWLRLGRMEDAEEPYSTIALRVDLALEKYHASRAILHAKLAKDDPRALEWELERRFRDQWAAPDRSGSVNIRVTIEAERRDLVERMLGAADRLLGHDPDLLARFVSEVASEGAVIDGDADELPELAP